MSAAADLSYDDAQVKAKKFLLNYYFVDDDGQTVYKYRDSIKEISNRRIDSLVVKLDEIVSEGDDVFASVISSNTRRYQDIFSKAVDEILPEPDDLDASRLDALDNLLQQRQEMHNKTLDPTIPNPVNNQIPALLKRRYQVRFIPCTTTKPFPIRGVRASCVGSLVSVKGMVTRVTDVRPMISVVAYSCDRCGCENYQEVSARQFMPMMECSSTDCQRDAVRGKLHMQTRGSKFLKFQEARLQELAEQVPIGHVPRSITVHLSESCTRTCKPGDVVTVSGVFLPIPLTGFRAMKAGLTADTYIDAMEVLKHKQSYSEQKNAEDVETEILKLRSGKDKYERLAASIAPEIFGHEHIKKVLLLMLIGGVTKKMDDGMRIRGDINVCLMGDPGVAKSQLLKHIATIAPRGIYTTGRGSSGVGLTAAVVRDPVTNEFVLEGGALVLADQGICCIDEFDKMDETDRTAIHEVMEQQTASIAKAGITTTLNARTTVLAAANPAYGRYDPSRSVVQNIRMPAALLSRFDIIFLLLDKADMTMDRTLAKHITYVHQNNCHPPLAWAPVTAAVLRAYIAKCREYEPVVPATIQHYISEQYVDMRANVTGEWDKQAYVSARTLLSVLRLAQAHARLFWRNAVSKEDVNEAIGIMKAAFAGLTEISKVDTRQTRDKLTESFAIVRQAMLNSRRHRNVENSDEPYVVQRVELLDRLRADSISDDDFSKALEVYSALGVWVYDNDSITLIDTITDGLDTTNLNQRRRMGRVLAH